jgi:aminoglycoside phosphotransferase (APT) family kinase protein
MHALVEQIHGDAQTLADALQETPQTFVAGDWKLGNVGRRDDGRTVLLDWAYPGEAPPAFELAWYLALNRARIPESKEATIAWFRARLEHHGVDTTGWWERQLGLCLLGMAAVIGWEKAVGDADELAWWEAAAVDGATWLS